MTIYDYVGRKLRRLTTRPISTADLVEAVMREFFFERPPFTLVGLDLESLIMRWNENEAAQLNNEDGTYGGML